MNINHAILKKISNMDDQTCFGCGENNLIGLHMQFSTDGQRVYSFIKVPSAMTGWAQTVHGGIISTILDEIMGWTAIYLLKKIAVTKSMTIDFLKPLSVEKQICVVGSIQEIQSDRQVLITGEIYSDEETLCAKARGTFATMSAQTAVRLGVMNSEYMERFKPILNQNEGV